MAGLLSLTREKQTNKVIEVEIGRIFVTPDRGDPDIMQSDVSALADSMASNGMIQPLTVRRVNDKFELLSGEIFLHAAKMCEIPYVPCYVQELNDRESAILVLVERIRRQDLPFFEEAEQIAKLIEHYGMTQEEAASRLGKAQSTIANKLRLLRLTPHERELILKHGLTERHSRALLRIASPSDRQIILDNVIENSLNVEKTELLIDEFIGSGRLKQPYKKRSVTFQHIKIFISSINRIVENMRSAGITAETKKIQGDGYIEYRVRIPMGG